MKSNEVDLIPSRKAQWETLLDFLLSHDGVTGRYCIEQLGILNYKGRIHDIRKHGYTVKTKMVKVRNRYGGYSEVAFYYIPKPTIM